MTDFDLLQEYANRGSDAAFGTLVKRYANLVYSAALRQTGDWHSAEDVAQAVFITLARKAGVLRPGVVLSGWLLRTTRFVSLNARRREFHRRHFEEQAGPEVIGEFDAAWSRIAPVIDEALDSLAQRDREALVLRFFEQKSFREIGQLIGTSEDGAHKRVQRALDKLRTDFLKKGIALSATVLVGAISTGSAEAAPAHLTGLLLEAVFKQGGGKASVLAEEAAKGWRQQRIRSVLMSVVALSLVLLSFVVARFLPARVAPTDPLKAVPGPAGPARAVAATPVLPRNTRQLLLRVIDSQTGQPVRNARLTQIWDRGYALIETNFLGTDQAGEASIDFDPTAKDLWNLRIDILSEGHVPKFVSWAAARGDLLQDIPARYETQIDPGAIIGGVVRAEDNKSISGARVQISGLLENPVPRTPATREGEAFDHDETTDAQGRWLCNHAPTQLQKLSFNVSHPDFIGATFRSSTLGVSPDANGGQLTETDFRQQLAVMVLKSGRVAIGRVIDVEGSPIPDAVITATQGWEQPPRRETTGIDGQFRIPGLDTNRTIFTIERSGYRILRSVLEPANQPENLQFTLEKSLELRVWISDDTGRNLPGASMSRVSAEARNGPGDWTSMSDADGKVQWACAPERSQYLIAARGYQSSKVELKADGLEHQVILHALTNHEPLRVSGKVIDSASREPVDQFEVWAAVTVIENFSSGLANRVGLAPELKTTGRQGRFAFLAVDSFPAVTAFDVNIKAEGYFPSRQTISGPLTNECQLVFELSPLNGIEGTVESPGGEPIGGAIVMFCGENKAHPSVDGAWSGAYMSTSGQLDFKLSGASQAETDSHGHFKMPTSSVRGMLIAAHQTGFAASMLSVTGRTALVRLQPWAALEGVLKIGAQPGSHKTISIVRHLETGAPRWLTAYLTATTDEDGHFSIVGIPPGEWDISPHSLRVQLEAGVTNHVVLGGTGRKVLGRLVDKIKAVSFTDRGYHLSLSTKVISEPRPWRNQFQSLDEYIHAKSDWIKRQSSFQHSEEGRIPMSNRRSYSLEIQPDGRFVIDEVLPGDYVLSLSGDPLKLDPNQMEMLENFDKEVRVPMPEKANAAAVDLGDLEVSELGLGGK